MIEFKVLHADNADWQKYIENSAIHDFHHTAFYHQLDNDNQSVLMVAQNEEDFVALPLVIRLIENSDRKDATSVYGYCGPISNKRDFREAQELISFFWKEFDSFCKDNKIVSVFSRLHPLINQTPFFGDYGEVVPLNKTVYIDLSLPPEEQRRQFSKSNKWRINKGRKKLFIVERGINEKNIEAFSKIYRETMDRLEADRSYYFGKSYFKKFLQNPSFQSELLIAKADDKPVAAGIFTLTEKIMQYHLSGTLNDYMRESPMRLLIDEARLIANEKGLRYFHLGGGYGGQNNDPLFKFKADFSKKLSQFSVWKYIANPKAYNELVEKRGLDNHNHPSSFFPLYRQ